MQNLPLAEIFSTYLNESPRHHFRLFEMLGTILKEDKSLSHLLCLEMAHYILANMERTFVERRGILLFRFLLANLCSKRKTSKDTGCTAKYLLHEVVFPFQKKQVMGLLVELDGIYGEIESIEQSFLSCHEELLLIEHGTLPFIHIKQNRTALYFEVQKRVGDFLPDEVGSFKESLEEIGIALASRSSTVVSSLEFSFKTLNSLMNEMGEGDIPHVFIDLCEQIPGEFSFFVFLCKGSGSGHASFAQLLAHPHIEEKMRLNEGEKEGIVLKMDLLYSSSLSLVEGRKMVGNLLHRCIGEFRDVNGGVFEKIESNFNALSQDVPRSHRLLRSFFDSITPEEMQAMAPPSMLKEIYLANKEIYLANEESLTGNAHTLLEKEDWIAAIIKMDKGFEKEWKTTLSKSLPGVGFSQMTLADKVILSVFLSTRNNEQKALFKGGVEYLFNEQCKEARQILRLCTTSRFTSFDPRIGVEEETSYLHKMLFEGLMRIGPTGEAEPAIAHKVKISDGGKHYRFFLRKSTWSNGMPLTVHDFLYSWKMILMRKDLAPLSYLFDSIENVREIKEGKMPLDALGVKVIDDYALDVKLLSPCVPFLEVCALALFSPICQAIDEKHPNWAEIEGAKHVCNGPFCLERKEANGGVTLKKNPLYWDADKVKLEGVTIPLVSQEEARERFLNKEVDALLYFFYKDRISILPRALEVNHLMSGYYVLYLALNCSVPPFNNKKVRKALFLAINKDKLAQAFSKEAFPAVSFFSHGYEGRSRNRRGGNHILEGQKLLMQALDEDLEVRNTLFDQTLTVLEPREELGNRICENINEALGLYWRVSIVKPLSTQRHFDKKRGFCASLFGWFDRIHDPLYFLDTFSSPDNFANLSHWTHPSMQTIIEEAKCAETKKRKRKLTHLAEDLLWEELPMIPLFRERTLSLYYSNVQGLYANDLQQFDIRFSFKQ